MRKYLLCVVLVLAMVLTACGGDEKPTDFSDLVSGQPTKSGDNKKENEVKNESENKDIGQKDDTKTGSSDSKKDDGGAASGAQTVTELVSDENVHNIGGIGFIMPDGMKKKNVFVGPCVTYELSKSGVVLYGWSYDLEAYLNGIEDKSKSEEFRELLKKRVSEEKKPEEVSPRYLNDGYEVQNIELFETAGYKGERVVFKGILQGDVYKDGPIKAYAEVMEESVFIYNDVDDSIIFLDIIYRVSAYDNVKKQIDEMFATAIPGCTKPLEGSLDERYLENGGFSVTIPECYGPVWTFYYNLGDYHVLYGDDKNIDNLAYYLGIFLWDYAREGVEEIDAYQAEYEAEFGKEAGNFWDEDIKFLASRITTDWVDFYAANIYSTREEFDEWIPEAENLVPRLLSPGFKELETLSDERVSIDGMNGVKFKFSVKTEDDKEYILHLVIVNNNKSRFVSLISSAFEADSENVDSFDTMIAGMKNISK